MKQKTKIKLRALKMEITEHKSSFVVYTVLRALVILIMVLQVFNKNYENVFYCALTLLLLVIPSLVQVELKIELPTTLEIIILLFIFAAEILGEIGSYYTKFPYWDTMLHTINGFLAAAIGFSLVDLLNQHKKAKFNLSPLYMAVVAFCFSMTIGVMWEFFECAMDVFLHTDMQKDTIVNSISTVMLDPTGGTNVIHINGIEDVIVNGKPLGLGGYLDIGLLDTMKDLFVNFIGAVVFSIIGFFYVKRRGKGRFARKFIPRMKKESADYLKLVEEEEKTVENLRKKQEIVWINPGLKKSSKGMNPEVSIQDVEDAEKRLLRFAPFIEKCFPVTRETHGIIESPLIEIEEMKKLCNELGGCNISGKLLLKQDSHLAIAGSVKARGGIYEVLKHTEDIAFEQGFLSEDEDYGKLADEKYRGIFSQYTIQVGSTGNLGLSIGIASAAIGYQVIVHMSADAKQWKKDLLRSHGVKVVEYAGDYSAAVQQGRKLSDENPNSYFVDDENSKNLFLGYAVAAERLLNQLNEKGIVVDKEHPLFVYIPCGVGGAPGGVTYGLKELFGEHVHCFFVEPVQAPCMLLGMATGLHDKISVQDIGLTGVTEADGLAVGRPSRFVGRVMESRLSGIFTLKDSKLYDYMRMMLKSEDIFLEPSACASFEGPIQLEQYEETKEYLKKYGLEEKMENATHIAWATGGGLVPEKVREEYEFSKAYSV